jgi:hypothetical protein
MLVIRLCVKNLAGPSRSPRESTVTRSEWRGIISFFLPGGEIKGVRVVRLGYCLFSNQKTPSDIDDV